MYHSKIYQSSCRSADQRPTNRVCKPALLQMGQARDLFQRFIFKKFIIVKDTGSMVSDRYRFVCTPPTGTIVFVQKSFSR